MRARAVLLLALVGLGAGMTLLLVERGPSPNEVAVPEARSGDASPVEADRSAAKLAVEATRDVVALPAEDSPSTDAITVDLPFDARALYGRVVDAEDLSPIAGARVDVYHEDATQTTLVARDDTDAAGIYRIGGRIEVERMRVQVSAPGYATARFRQTSGVEREIALEPATSLSARVIHGAGRVPAVDATVWLETKWSDGWMPIELARATTDDEGRCTLSGLRRDVEMTLSVQVEGWLRDVRPLILDRVSSGEVEILLQDPGALTLELVRAEDESLAAGVDGRLVRGHTTFGRVGIPFETDATGRTELLVGFHKPSSKYRIIVLVEGFLPAPLSIRPADLEGPVRVPLVRGGRIRGQVTDEEGDPVAVADVSLDWLFQYLPGSENEPDGPHIGMGGTGPFWAKDTTDAEGRFLLEQIEAPGEYDVASVGASHRGFAPTVALIELPVSGTTVTADLTLTRAATIRGTAIDGDRPFVGTVRAKSAGFSAASRTNDVGAFVLQGVVPGDVELTLRRDGVSQTLIVPPECHRETVRVAPGELLDHDLLVARDLNQSIRGHVLSSDHEPLEDALVQLLKHVETEDGRFLVQQGASASTDASGAFDLPIDEIGKPYAVVADYQGVQVSQDPAAPGDEIDLVLPPLGRLRLEPVGVRAESSPGRLQDVRWWPVGAPRDVPYTGWQRLVPAHADGSFGLTLPLGTWDVEIDCPGFAPIDLLGVTIDPGDMTKLDLPLDSGTTLEVEVRIVGESPDVHPRIFLTDGDRTRPGGLPYRRWGKTLSEPTGTFEWLRPGRYELRCDTAGWSLDPSTIDVPDVPEHTVVVRCFEER